MIKIIIFFMLFTLSVFAEDNYMKEDGTFDWENYLEYGVKRKAYSDTNTLIQLFNYYDIVKDDPFSLSTLSNDIVSSIYNDSSFFDSYGDVYSDIYDEYDKNGEEYYNMYKILYDNIDKFDIEDKKEIRQSLEWFLNDKLNEVKLFDEISYQFINGEENNLIKIELPNSDDEVNGLTIKHNSKVVAGILGGRTDYEYTMNYNGKKDVRVKHSKLEITYEAESPWGGENYKASGIFNVVLIGKNSYYIYEARYMGEPGSGMLHRFKSKIRDLNNHEDGITSVKIIK